MQLEKIIKSSLLSEKTYSLAEKNTFVLKVDLKATKPQIKAAVESLLGVKVESVNTSILRGKSARRARNKSSRSSMMVKKPNIKKAFVCLKKGESMPEFLPKQTNVNPAPSAQ